MKIEANITEEITVIENIDKTIITAGDVEIVLNKVKPINDIPKYDHNNDNEAEAKENQAKMQMALLAYSRSGKRCAS